MGGNHEEEQPVERTVGLTTANRGRAQLRRRGLGDGAPVGTRVLL